MPVSRYSVEMLLLVDHAGDPPASRTVDTFLRRTLEGENVATVAVVDEIPILVIAGPEPQ